MYGTDARGSAVTGMFGWELSAGTTIDGWGIVTGKSVGVSSRGRTVTVTRQGTGKKHRMTPDDTRTFLAERRVPGTRYRTDWPAGPVGRKPGAEFNGAHGDTPADRHSALIDNLTYA